MTILGIGDASENDTFASTNWQMAKDRGCEFGIVRATTTGAWDYKLNKPTLRIDSMWTTNAAKMQSANMEIFPYIWFDPRVIPGFDQASFFVDAIKNIVPKGNQFVVVDVEKSGSIAYNSAALGRLKQCLETVSASGYNPAIYTYPSGVSEFETMADISWMASYPLMVAHWDVTAPKIPWPWFPGDYSVWQFTAYMLGSKYGFNAKAPGYSTPRICMAVM